MLISVVNDDLQETNGLSIKPIIIHVTMLYLTL